MGHGRAAGGCARGPMLFVPCHRQLGPGGSSPATPRTPGQEGLAGRGGEGARGAMHAAREMFRTRAADRCPRQEHRPQLGCISNVRIPALLAFSLRSRRPAQILSKAAARQHLGGVPHKSSQDTPVIFFGTSEIAWIGAKDGGSSGYIASLPRTVSLPVRLPCACAAMPNCL